MQPEHAVMIIGYVLGAGGFFSFLFTFRYSRKKARYDADQVEIDNIKKLISTWQMTAEKFKKQADDAVERENKIMLEVSLLRKEITKLTSIQNKIVKLLDKITHENFAKIIEQIKSELSNENAT
jgi:esterase/lipase